jgi:DNA replication protein DnaC
MASNDMDRLLALLKRLHLRHLAQRLPEHLAEADRRGLDALAFLLHVAEAEVAARNETTATARIQQAHFPEVCLLDSFDFTRQPSLNRGQVLDLGRLAFLDRRQSVIWIGPSGVGKTHLAIGLGVVACRAGYHVLFLRAFDLLKRLWASLADDSLDDVLDVLCKPDLLIVDELGNSPRPAERDYTGIFFELVSRRHRRGSTMVTTNWGFDQWSQALGAPAQVTPAIDRLIEGAHIITFPADAASYRQSRTDVPPPLPRPPRRRRPRPRPPGKPPT